MSKNWILKGCAAAVFAALGTLTPALAQIDANLQARLNTRFEGDRTGACAVAAIVEPTGVKRALACAAPRQAGGPTLDDPIEKYLPPGSAVPSQGDRKIRVRDLLTHSSALPRMPPNFNPRDAGDPYADMTERDLLAGLATARLQGSIGGQAAYSNFGMMVLSVAVARAHQADFGGDFERALTERLFKPLKMDGAFVARRPTGVRLLPGHLSTGEVTPNWSMAAA